MAAETELGVVRYKAVIFDLFGTLVDNFSSREYDRVLAEMASLLSLPARDFARLWVATFEERVTGRLGTLEEAIAQSASRLGLHAADDAVAAAARLRLDFSRRALVPRPDAIETLARLRATGRKIGLISDCTAEVPVLWPETAFAPLVDAATFSCSIGLRKPDPRIYRSACERLSVTPSDCLYVGDGSSQELSGASRVGMQAMLLRASHEIPGEVIRDQVEGWDGPVIAALGEVLTLVG